jgi:hypothetical protein
MLSIRTYYARCFTVYNFLIVENLQISLPNDDLFSELSPSAHAVFLTLSSYMHSHYSIVLVHWLSVHHRGCRNHYYAFGFRDVGLVTEHSFFYVIYYAGRSNYTLGVKVLLSSFDNVDVS